MPVPTVQTVPADLHFLSPEMKEKPFNKTTSADSNIVTIEKEVQVTDLRSLTDSQLEGYTTDTSGFQWVKHASKLVGEDFWDEEKVKELYYPEVDQYARSSGSTASFLIGGQVPEGYPRREAHLYFRPYQASRARSRGASRVRPRPERSSAHPARTRRPDAQGRCRARLHAPWGGRRAPEQGASADRQRVEADRRSGEFWRAGR
jgi:hypothetical protein